MVIDFLFSFYIIKVVRRNDCLCDKETDMTIQVKRLSRFEVAEIVEEFASRGVTTDLEFFIIPVTGEFVYIHRWVAIPWSDDKGDTVARFIPIRERIKQILPGLPAEAKAKAGE